MQPVQNPEGTALSECLGWVDFVLLLPGGNLLVRVQVNLELQKHDRKDWVAYTLPVKSR